MHLGGMMDVYEKNLPLLAQRSNAEAARVKCNIESLLAVQQDVIQPTEQVPYYCARSVYDRNRRMFDQLSERKRMSLEKDDGGTFATVTNAAGVPLSDDALVQGVG